MSGSHNCNSPNAVLAQQSALGLLDAPISDPPPPYPSPERRLRSLRVSRRHPQRATPHVSAWNTLSDAVGSPGIHPRLFPTSDDPIETTPLLRPSNPRQRRANSHSTIVSSNSFSRTVLSLCHDSEDETDVEALGGERISHPGQGPILGQDGHAQDTCPGRWLLFRRAWARYFRPMGRRAYHAAVFHLMVVNFPYALIAWVYLFVFTLTGTTLLITLPLGALLCFLDLLGARAFARGELALQARFHGPLAYPPPYPPRPIFQRTCAPELPATETSATGVQYETSFYKNAYAMFTDATTYQALFYFLVVKPSITLCMSTVLMVLVPVSYALVLPAPLMLRIVRRAGIWQANVAVEGL